MLRDEWVDRRLAAGIRGHDVKTVPEVGWATLKNGDLLSRAQHEFDALVTTDRNLPFQQDLSRFRSPSSCCVHNPIAWPICAVCFLNCSPRCLSPGMVRLHGSAPNTALEQTRFARCSPRALGRPTT